MRSLQDFKRGRIELGVNFSSAQSWLEDQWECFCQFWNWIWKDLNDNGWVPLSVCHQKCSLVWLEVSAFIIINSFYSPINLLSKTNNIGHFYILHALLINSSLSSYKGVSYISKWRSLFSVGLIFLSEVLNNRDLDISNTCTCMFLLLNMDVSRMPFLPEYFRWFLFRTSGWQGTAVLEGLHPLVPPLSSLSGPGPQISQCHWDDQTSLSVMVRKKSIKLYLRLASKSLGSLWAWLYNAEHLAYGRKNDQIYVQLNNDKKCF